MKTIHGILFHLALTVMVIGGYIYGREGAQNVVLFTVWIMLPLVTIAAGGVLLSEQCRRKAAKDDLGPSWLSPLVRCNTAACIAILVWAGAWSAALPLAAIMFLTMLTRHELKRTREQQHAEGTAR